MHATMHCFKTGLAYYATTVSYACKMFVKSPPELIKTDLVVSGGITGAEDSIWFQS